MGGSSYTESMAERERSFRGTTFTMTRSTVRGLGIVLRHFGGPAVATRDYVLVHGIGVSARYFQPLAVELARTGRVWLIDLPGYGSAPDPERDVSIVDHSEVLFDAITEAGIENPVIVGHSMGCQVVSELAVRHPEASDSIVLLAPTIERGKRSLLTQALRLSLDMLLEPPRANWVVLTDYVFRCGIPYYLRQLPHLLGDEIEQRMPRLTARTLIVTGDRDRVVPVHWARELVALAPNASLAVVEGPHVIMFTDPDAIARHIREVFE